MPVKITVKGNQETNEYQDAIVLKEIFEAEFNNPTTDGEILIVSNVTLFGQETKDIDIIALGKFNRYSTRVKTKSKPLAKDDLLAKTDRILFVNNFCFVFETKRHRAQDIQLNGTRLLVKYSNGFSDVTTQSEKQKYALYDYFKDRLNFSPYICNFIWLTSVSNSSIEGLFDNDGNSFDKHNYLPDNFNLQRLFQLACAQSTPFHLIDEKTQQPKPYSVFTSVPKKQEYDFNKIEEIFDLFTKIKNGVGTLTRIKIEQITKGILKDQQYAQAIGEKLVVISGRAGTGKTIKLLTIACDLAEDKGARSLILTYNYALASDMKRTLAFLGIHTEADDKSVSIFTIHAFFYKILVGFGFGTEGKDSRFIPNYLSRYNELLEELYEYVDNELIGKPELEDQLQEIYWDYVLIDESQDCSEIEKKLIFSIFGKERVIIADGVDQLIRSQKKCNWKQGLKLDTDFKQTNEKRGLRQKSNLIKIINQVALKLGVNWMVEPKKELTGGKVIIKIGEYTKELHERGFKICKDDKNDAYDMMFLVPPSLVKRQQGTDKFDNEKEFRSFALKDEFKKMGIKIWDGTNTDLRNPYPVELDCHKLFQYESCRGLEGWVVVCLDLDEFVRYKCETFKKIDVGEGEQQYLSVDQQRNEFATMWTLIPLTRAMDTLIITIKNKDSEIGSVLKEVYHKYHDNIEWIE